jgi:hypothetical protein
VVDTWAVGDGWARTLQPLLELLRPAQARTAEQLGCTDRPAGQASRGPGPVPGPQGPLLAAEAGGSWEAYSEL